MNKLTLLMAVGGHGLSGAIVREHVAEVCQHKNVNATIRCPRMAVSFALVKEKGSSFTWTLGVLLYIYSICRYKICNHQPCPVGEVSFRAHQCSKYDNVYYQGSMYKWLPFFDNSK